MSGLAWCLNPNFEICDPPASRTKQQQPLSMFLDNSHQHFLYWKHWDRMFQTIRQSNEINNNSDFQYSRNCPEVDVLYLSKQTVPRTSKWKFCCMCKTRVLFLPFQRKFARNSRTDCLLQTQKHGRSLSFRRNVCCSVGHRHKQNKSWKTKKKLFFSMAVMLFHAFL